MLKVKGVLPPISHFSSTFPFLLPAPTFTAHSGRGFEGYEVLPLGQGTPGATSPCFGVILSWGQGMAFHSTLHTKPLLLGLHPNLHRRPRSLRWRLALHQPSSTAPGKNVGHTSTTLEASSPRVCPQSHKQVPLPLPCGWAPRAVPASCSLAPPPLIFNLDLTDPREVLPSLWP